MVNDVSDDSKPSFLRRIFCYCEGLRYSTSQGEHPSAASRLGRLLPFRERIARWIRNRPRVIEVDPAQLFMGSQAGLDPLAFAGAAHSLRWTSMTIADSPHLRLLRLALDSPTGLSDAEIKATEYWSLARVIFEVSGEFFGARDEDGLVTVTRNFIDWGLGRAPRSTPGGGSRPGDGVLVARVSGTDRYQILDGHHRAAIAAVRGESSLEVLRTRLSYHGQATHATRRRVTSQ